MADDRWWRGFENVVVDHLSPGSRVLDIGCGDGGFVERLCERSLDALGVDPRAPAHPRLVPELVEEATTIGDFDAVCAVMALHHVDLDAVVPAICRLLRPHGHLFVYDFAWDLYDERAAAWLARHDRSGADHSVEAWRAEHGDLHTGATVRSAIVETVELREERERPYLGRMLGRLELEAGEEALIGDGRVPALGRWYLGRRIAG